MREREVFLQQPIALERSFRHRQQCLRIGESNLPDARGWQKLERACGPLAWYQHGTQRRCQAQLAELVRDGILTGDEEWQTIEGGLGELEPGSGSEPNTHPTLDALRNRKPVEREIRRESEVTRRYDFDWPERDVLPRPELACRGVLACGQSDHRAASRHHFQAGGQAWISGVRPKLRDQHRRRRRQVMRMDDLEQRLREPGK